MLHPFEVAVALLLALITPSTPFEVAVATVELDIGVDQGLAGVAPGPTGRMHALLPSYAVRPGDDAAQRVGELTAHASALGFDLPAEALVAQVESMRRGHALPLPAGLQPASGSSPSFGVAPVPFAFHRLLSAASAPALGGGGGGDGGCGADDDDVACGGSGGALENLVGHCRLAIANARSGLSRLLAPRSEGVLRVEGMSDGSIRHLLSNLCGAPGTR
jgi:hypothetical protein